MVELTRFALPGETQHTAVVSVSEQVGQTELAPVVLWEKAQQFFDPDVERREAVIFILLCQNLSSHKKWY